MQSINSKTIFKVLAGLFAVVLILVLIIYKDMKEPKGLSPKKEREPLIAYLAVHREGDVFIYKYDLANSKVIAQQKVLQPPEEGTGWWADMVEFQSYPDDIFLVETMIGSTTKFNPGSYLIIIDRKTLSHKQTIPLDFYVRKVEQNIPEKDHLILDAIRYLPESKEYQKKEFLFGPYTLKNGVLKEDKIPDDISGVELEYSIYYDKRLIMVRSPYREDLRSYLLPPGIEQIYDFDKYVQLLMISGEKKALIAPFRKREENVRDLLLIDLVENRILNEPIKLYYSKKDDPSSFSNILVDVSPDGNKLYMIENYQDKEDYLRIYDIDTFNLIKEIPANRNLSGTSSKTIFTDNGKYLIIIFSAPRKGVSIPFSYIFLIDTEKNDILNIIDLAEGGTSGIILEK